VPTEYETEPEEPDVTDVRAYTEYGQPTVQGRSFPEPGLQTSAQPAGQQGGSGAPPVAGEPAGYETRPEEPAVTDVRAYTEYGRQSSAEGECVQCHEPLRPGAKFCSHCGQPVEPRS